MARAALMMPTNIIRACACASATQLYVATQTAPATPSRTPASTLSMAEIPFSRFALSADHHAYEDDQDLEFTHSNHCREWIQCVFGRALYMWRAVSLVPVTKEASSADGLHPLAAIVLGGWTAVNSLPGPWTMVAFQPTD
jgi:hypothetical protein